MIYKKLSFLLALGLLTLACSKTTKGGSSASSQTDSKKAGSGSKVGTDSGTEGGDGSGDAGGDLGGLQALLGALGGGGTGSTTDDTPAEAAADPNSVQWSSAFGDPFLSMVIYEPQQNYLTQANQSLNPATNADYFECPGDSLIVGFRGVYDKTKSDRQLQAYCQFYEDGTGRPMVKKSCQNVSSAIAAGEDQKNPIFNCPKGTFLAGFRPYWIGTKNDRAYDLECCELANEDGKKMEYLTSEGAPVCESAPSPQGNHWKDILDWKCQGGVYDPMTGQQNPAGSVIQQVITSWDKTQNDRQWSMQCCVIGLPAAAEPAK